MLFRSVSTHLAPVKFMFERKGFVQVSLDRNLANFDKSVEELIEAALGADAEDFDQQPDEEHPDNVSLKVRVLHLLCSRLAQTSSVYLCTRSVVQSLRGCHVEQHTISAVTGKRTDIQAG